MSGFGHSSGQNVPAPGGYASPMMPFGSPGSHHGGSAPPTPTQQFSTTGVGNLPPAMMWGSPRGNPGGAVTTPPQFHQAGGGSGLNPQTSPRVRQQLGGPPLPSGPHFGGFGHPQPVQGGNFISPPMMGSHQASPLVPRPPFGHPQVGAKNIRPSTPINNPPNIGAHLKLEAVKVEAVEILSSDSSSSSSSDET